MNETASAYTQEFRDEVVRAYMEDSRACAIGKKFSVHHSTVKRWAAELNGGNGNGNGNGKGHGGNGKCQVEEGEGEGVTMPELQLALAGTGDAADERQVIAAREVESAYARIDRLIVRAEKAYLTELVKPENVEGTSTKDAAAIFKTLAEVELKRQTQRLMLDAAKSQAVDGRNADEGDVGFKPGLLDWERVLRRLMSDGDAE